MLKYNCGTGLEMPMATVTADIEALEMSKSPIK